jgi:FixJ family two-component response regulator
MPGMTGLELSQYLTRSGIDIPTIIISANADFKVRERCESAGIVAFLSKPLETALLLDAIGAASSG